MTSTWAITIGQPWQMMLTGFTHGLPCSRYRLRVHAFHTDTSAFMLSSDGSFMLPRRYSTPHSAWNSATRGVKTEWICPGLRRTGWSVPAFGFFPDGNLDQDSQKNWPIVLGRGHWADELLVQPPWSLLRMLCFRLWPILEIRQHPVDHRVSFGIQPLPIEIEIMRRRQSILVTQFLVERAQIVHPARAKDCGIDSHSRAVFEVHLVILAKSRDVGAMHGDIPSMECLPKVRHACQTKTRICPHNTLSMWQRPELACILSSSVACMDFCTLVDYSPEASDAQSSELRLLQHLIPYSVCVQDGWGEGCTCPRCHEINRVEEAE